ncbi:MAG: S41 family peptidase, partial [Planctomycetes bacterium]|nr:S41 family peptidase [Planctomycetota bacterium]
FSTLPAKLRSASEQKKRNTKSLAVLLETLRDHYSYYDLRVDDWDALVAKHQKGILAARSDMGFAARCADMLESTEDIHMTLGLRGQVFATGKRAVDPLFREAILKRLINGKQAGPGAIYGRTDDGIGYLMIAAWTQQIDTTKIGDAIRELADTKAMIVDVRPNSGGDELLAKEVAAWFVDGTKIYAKNRYRTGAGKDGFGKILERGIDGHGGDRHYSGRVAVLTSRNVMSSNEAFVLMMKQAKDCIVVGQPTFGSSGNPKPFTLPNDVVVVVPTWQAMLPDGTPFEGKGIEPDVLVECTGDDFQSRDPIFEAALAKLRAK